jgi:PleD family two-component response regulator
MSGILFADDDEGLRTMVREVLRSGGYEPRLASSGAEALDEVRRDPPEIAILDYRMGRPDGFEVCRRIKDDPSLSHVAVLILTGQGEMEYKLQGFDAGADDYLAKPFDPRELLARVSALLRQARQHLDRNPTTRLPGGTAVHGEVERRVREGEPFALCYFDLDHFKPFADHFGFAVADDAIIEAGEAVRAVAQGPEHFVGHVGGDDFVVLCPVADARAIAEGARRRFAEALPAHLPEDAVRRGTYRAEDRYGEVRDFPLTRLSAAVVRVDPASWVSLDRLGEVVAAAKRRAKRDEGGGIEEVDLA